MKSFIFIFVSFILIQIYNPLYSKDFEVPKNYSFNTQEDCKKHESDILKCIDYLENSPLDDFSDKRKNINAFFVKWLSGTPDVSINIRSYVMGLVEKNEYFLLIFLCGWTKYSLLNSYDNDEIKCNLAGLENVLKVYKMGNGVTKDLKIDKIVKIKENGNLENWIIEQLGKKK